MFKCLENEAGKQGFFAKHLDITFPSVGTRVRWHGALRSHSGRPPVDHHTALRRKRVCPSGGHLFEKPRLTPARMGTLRAHHRLPSAARVIRSQGSVAHSPTVSSRKSDRDRPLPAACCLPPTLPSCSIVKDHRRERQGSSVNYSVHKYYLSRAVFGPHRLLSQAVAY
jgi:hypothetical protein